MKLFIYGCLILTICRLAASYVFSTFDDAYITFRYARNIAEGIGFVYNIKERVLGTTAPLFALIGSIPVRFGISLPRFFVLFNILCDLGSLYLIFRFLFNQNRMLFILFVILFSLDPGTNRIAVGGMEANLFLFCSLLGIVLYFQGKKMLAFILLAIIYFLRPEALILFTILIFYEWFVLKSFPLKYLIVCLLLVAPVLFMMYRYYGHLVPQSVIAKNQLGRPAFENLIREIFFPHASNYVLVPLAIFGIVRSVRQSPYYAICAIWLVLYSGAYCLRGPWVLNWYIYSIEVVQLIFAALAVVEILSVIPVPIKNSRIFLLSPFVLAGIWILVCFQMGRSKVEVNVFNQLRKDFGSGSARGYTFIADDIGAIGYYSRGYIYDNLMLVTPQAIEFANLRERIIHVQPDYLFLYTTPRHLKMISSDSVLSHNYHFEKRYSPGGEISLPENTKQLTEAYHLDYMLWKRNH